ncbi:sulfurtransferase [Peptostreptococcus faecalis]|uniref:sulfurtransferase n=1 Tax=Peptostreptococcus faecalis TaxID=2045015 RepID=UPI000C79B32B|nr:sulfurtransferase [Peptostreptococcus faecalis]
MKVTFGKKTLLMLFTVLFSLSVVGCAKTNTSTDNNSKEEKVATTKDDYSFDDNDYLTSISWLEKNMKENDKLLIIDARTDKEYGKGHIPGAINVSWQMLAKMDGKAGDKDWGTLQDAATLSKTLGDLGISKEKQVVVYGNKDAWGEDGRVVWSLKRAGIDARMLNGGIDLWSSEKKDVTKDIPEIKKVEVKIDKIDPDINISTDELKKEYDNLKIIDTREKDEYDGATKFGEARGGHLPKSINIPFNKFYNDDATIKSNDEIIKIMDESGIKKDDDIVTYCTGGIRSAHMALALKNAGYEKVRNYDSSFYEWAADESNEVVK